MLVSEAIDRTFNNWLHPAGVNRPSFDVLAEALDNSELDITLEGRITVPNDSILEIDSELVLTKSVAAATHEVTVSERGYLDTAVATHANGTRVYLDPMFSRKHLFDVLTTLIQDLYPQGVYRRVVDDTLFYTTAGTVALPSGTKDLLKASVAVVGSGTRYRRLRSEHAEYTVLYEFDPPKLQIVRGGTLNAQLVVVVAKDFTLPADETKDLTTICFVPASFAAHLPMGIAGTILQSRELPRVMTDEIKRLFVQQGVQVGSALNVGQALLTLYRQKVDAERRRLQDLDPPNVELTR